MGMTESLGKWLMTDRATSRIAGPPTWTRIRQGWLGSWSGDVAVDLGEDGFEFYEIVVELRLNDSRPSSPTLLLRVPDAQVAWHIDYNSSHRERGVLGQTTHLQLEGLAETTFLDPRRAASPPMDAQWVSEEQLRILWMAGCGILHVAIYEAEWVFHGEEGE